MFVEQGFIPKNNHWKYLLGSIITIAAATIGQVPLVIAIAIKSVKDNIPFPTDEDKMMTFLSSNTTLFLVLFSFLVALLALFLVIKHLHHQSIVSVTTTRKKIDWKRILFAFSIWGLFSAGTTLVTYYTSPNNLVFNFKPIPFLILAIIATLLIPIQTSTEEYIFRGYLMQGFGLLAKNKWFPLLMTSLIFGTMHIFNPEVDKMGYIILVYYIGTGFFLGIITLMDEGMELALGFHAANNLITALLVTSNWSALQTNSIFKDVSEPSKGFEIILPVFIIFPLLIFIFSKKYKWNNWKEKLTGKINITTN